MKKTLLLLIITIFTFLFNNAEANSIKVVSHEEIQELDREVTRKEVFMFFWDFFTKELPESYKYIDVKFVDLWNDLELRDSLQKLIYLDLIRNSNTKINPSRKINLYTFLKLSENILSWDFINWSKKEDLLKELTTVSDFRLINSILDEKEIEFDFWIDDKTLRSKKLIFSDVYDTILNHHYEKDNLDKEWIIDSAIEWLVDWVDDKYTTYFPPTESKDFYDSLNWEYEWIWSYVDMEEPWMMRIVSPISDSPAEKAWLKWWDLILKVNGIEVTKENSLKEVVSWIKWKAWTIVKLTIKRWEKVFDVDVTRWKIIITDIEYKLLSKNIFYLDIKSFWDSVSDEFKDALNELNKNKKVKKIIIDLRNNGWGYLWEVVNMLWYFVPAWKPVAVVRYPDDSKVYYSKWIELVDFSKYEIVILENSWTASASEILIWTLKDYYPDITIIWEKSFWKGSVQSMKSYVDWSSLKFTVAKWFSWLTETWIDWIWITPDIELEFDLEKYKKFEIDNQLEKAKYN